MIHQEEYTELIEAMKANNFGDMSKDKSSESSEDSQAKISQNALKLDGSFSGVPLVNSIIKQYPSFEDRAAKSKLRMIQLINSIELLERTFQSEKKFLMNVTPNQDSSNQDDNDMSQKSK